MSALHRLPRAAHPTAACICATATTPHNQPPQPLSLTTFPDHPSNQPPPQPLQDIYGPSEAVIGQWLRLQPHRSDVQVVTKVTVMEEDVPRLSAELLEYVSTHTSCFMSCEKCGIGV